jgi:hypothetical protein
MMKKAILFVLVSLFAVGAAEAGVIRTSAHVVKRASRVAAKVAAKSAKLAWRVAY